MFNAWFMWMLDVSGGLREEMSDSTFYLSYRAWLYALEMAERKFERGVRVIVRKEA